MAIFNDMKLSINKAVKIIKVNGIDVTVKQYLPAEDKNAILEIAMQQADQGTILNTYNLQAFFDMYIIFKYTDIVFSNEEKDDILNLYDILESNGVINQIISAIPETEYSILFDNLNDMVKNYLTYRNSARALVEQFTLFAPEAAEKLKEVTQDFDEEKLKKVVQLAKSTGIDNKIGQ